MGYWEAQRLQRAADQAALAGVVWVPNKKDVADFRARSAVEGQGYNVLKPSSSTQDQYTLVDVQQAGPNERVFFESQTPPPDSPTKYRVTLTTKAPRYFMGVLGFGDYLIKRTATADYAQPARLGGSFNYFGTSSLVHDWTIPSQRNAGDAYYKTLYDRFFASNCLKATFQDGTVTGTCVGTFWLSMQGQHTAHNNGDAYNAIRSGTERLDTGGAFGGVFARNGGVGTYCNPAIDPETFFFQLTAAQGCNLNATHNGLPIYNLDTHPDSGGKRGFGFQIAVEVDRRALIGGGASAGDGPGALQNTRLNISIFDAGVNEYGSDEQFVSGDTNYSAGGDGFWPQTASILRNVDFNRGEAKSKQTFRPTAQIGTTNDPNYQCPTSIADPRFRYLRCGDLQIPVIPETSKVAATGDFTGGEPGRKVFNTPAGNGAMMRYSLYYPPAAQGVPTTFDTKGDFIAAFTTFDSAWKGRSNNVVGGGAPFTFPFATAGAPSNNERETWCYLAYEGLNRTEILNNMVLYNGEIAPLDSRNNLVYTCPRSDNTITTSGLTVQDVDFWYWAALRDKNIITASELTNPTAQAIRDKLFATDVTSLYNHLDPSQFCRNYFETRAYRSALDYQAGNSSLAGPARKAPMQQNAGGSVQVNGRVPFNIRGFDPKLGNANYFAPEVRFMPYRGWSCGWDFDSSNSPFMNPGPSSGTIDDVATLRSTIDGVKAQPFFHLSNWGYTGAGSKGRIAYIGGQRVASSGNNDLVVRPGVYLLHVQNYGGSFANRFAVKAEYENGLPINENIVSIGPGGTQIVTPITVPAVPQVYGIGSMTIYANADNQTGGRRNVIFDLAFIPKQNAGTTAVLELWDPGDLGTGLEIQILQPTGYGLKLNGSTVPVSTALRFTPTICPMYKFNTSQCVFGPSNTTLLVTTGGTQYFNGQWVLLAFQVPTLTTYENTFDPVCAANNVPTSLCYYYQINYAMLTNGRANDTTTWSLQIANQPVRLVQ
jgi:hypothetical protein